MKKRILFTALLVIVLIVIFSVSAQAAGYAGAPKLEAGETVVVPVDGSPPNFLEYITEKAYILIPVLYLLGFIIKKTPMIPDWLIPYILLVIGILAGMALVGWTIDGCIQGALVAGITVLANQLWKQGKEAAGGG